MTRACGIFISCGLAAWTLAIVSTSSAAELFAVQEDNRSILYLDTISGIATPAFLVPDGIIPSEFDGLSLAERGASLLYVEGTPGAVSPLYRLNRTTGAVLSSHPMVVASGFRAGLSFDTPSGNSIFVVDDGGGVGRQAGFGGAYNLPFVTNAPEIPGALGGDDFGRHFVTNFTGVIQEFDPVTGAILNSYPFPGPNMGGMAFDGVFLYGTDSANRLYTMNPNTGAVLHSVLVSGGNGGRISGLAASIPEPNAMLIMLLGGLPLSLIRRRGTRHSLLT